MTQKQQRQKRCHTVKYHVRNFFKYWRVVSLSQYHTVVYVCNTFVTIKIPPHLKRVATLPCEIHDAFWLMVSLPMARFCAIMCRSIIVLLLPFYGHYRVNLHWPASAVKKFANDWSSVLQAECRFGWPFVKRFALCYQTVICPVCDVRALWPNGWTVQDETWHAGMPWPWPHCVRWAPSSPSPKGGQSPFRPISVAAKWLDGSRCHLVWR